MEEPIRDFGFRSCQSSFSILQSCVVVLVLGQCRLLLLVCLFQLCIPTKKERDPTSRTNSEAATGAGGTATPARMMAGRGKVECRTWIVHGLHSKSSAARSNPWKSSRVCSGLLNHGRSSVSNGKLKSCFDQNSSLPLVDTLQPACFTALSVPLGVCGRRRPICKVNSSIFLFF